MNRLFQKASVNDFTKQNTLSIEILRMFQFRTESTVSKTEFGHSSLINVHRNEAIHAKQISVNFDFFVCQFGPNSISFDGDPR